MRKISEILTIARRYHAPSNGVCITEAHVSDEYHWGMCNAVWHAAVHDVITYYEEWYVRDYITWYVMDGDQTRYLSDKLGTACPHEISAWWDNHIAGLIKAGL